MANQILSTASILLSRSSQVNSIHQLVIPSLPNFNAQNCTKYVKYYWLLLYISAYSSFMALTYLITFTIDHLFQIVVLPNLEVRKSTLQLFLPCWSWSYLCDCYHLYQCFQTLKFLPNLQVTLEPFSHGDPDDDVDLVFGPLPILMT